MTTENYTTELVAMRDALLIDIGAAIRDQLGRELTVEDIRVVAEMANRAMRDGLAIAMAETA